MGPDPKPVHAPHSSNVQLSQQVVERLFMGQDSAIRAIEQAVRPYRLQIAPRPDGLRLSGYEVAVTLGIQILEGVASALKSTGRADAALITETATSIVQQALKYDLAFRLKGINNALRPLSLSQVAFMNALLTAERSLIFGVGPTGTGKTHLAIAAGMSLIAEGRFKNLIVTRPRVLLEGEVMTPALRAETAYDEQLTPIDHELLELIGHEQTKQLTDLGVVEIMPLGRMRGRTFNDSFVIIDEAQNMTVSKMRMAVTRLGRNSRMVITGDPAQIDLLGDQPSGLTHLLGLVSDADFALVHHFENYQIIRSDLVAKLESLYAGDDSAEMRAAA